MSNIASLFLYLSVYILSAFFLMQAQKQKTNRISLAFILGLSLPILLAAFRYDVGTDYLNYTWMYESASRLTFSQWLTTEANFSGIPLGIWIFSKISSSFNTPIVFFGLTACFIWMPVSLTIKKYLNQGAFLASLLMLTSIFSYGLNMMKQCIAISIIVWGLRYVHEQKILKYVLVVFFATFFHPTAFVAIGIYFLWTAPKTFFSFKKICIIGMAIVAILIFPTILQMLGGRWESYIQYQGEISNKVFYLEVLLLFAFVLLRKKLISLDFRNNLLIAIFFIGVILEFVGFYSPYIKRIALYYTFPQYLLIAQLPMLAKRNKIVVEIGVFAYIIGLFILNYYILGNSEIFPYQTIV